MEIVLVIYGGRKGLIKSGWYRCMGWTLCERGKLAKRKQAASGQAGMRALILPALD